MKTERNITTFKCDSSICKKLDNIVETTSGTGFPYDRGWKFLYNLEIKNSKDKKLAFREKHFCCTECLKDFIHDHILMEEEI